MSLFFLSITWWMMRFWTVSQARASINQRIGPLTKKKSLVFIFLMLRWPAVAQPSVSKVRFDGLPEINIDIIGCLDCHWWCLLLCSVFRAAMRKYLSGGVAESEMWFSLRCFDKFKQPWDRYSSLLIESSISDATPQSQSLFI